MKDKIVLITGATGGIGKQTAISLATINNAGSAVAEYKVTEDGFETNFETNVVAPYLLTALLLENCRSFFRFDRSIGFLAAQRFYEKNGFVEIDKNLLPKEFPVMSVDVKFYKYIVHK